MRRTGLIALAAVQVLLVAVLGTPVSAQTTTGGITGVVRDAGGGVMPGVTVKATHEATNAETTAVSNEVRRLRSARAGGRPLHGRSPSCPASRRRRTPTSSFA